jgi:beta-galactosidase
MPHRVMRKDAEILRHEFNLQRSAMLALSAIPKPFSMPAIEIPVWQYVGDESWKDLVVRNVQDMVRRDRNHPSIIIWGVRINGAPNNSLLYQRTKEAAKSLDDSGPIFGSMIYQSTHDWFQDIFAFDDYHSARDGSVGLALPLLGVPFLFSEAVGQFSYGSHGFNNKYRRAGEVQLRQKQALVHAQVHDWGVPKLGASFYRAQADPKVRPVIEPNFYWDFGPRTPFGPGERVAIFSNCETLELRIDGSRHAVLHPDRASFPHLKYPPFSPISPSTVPKSRSFASMGILAAL